MTDEKINASFEQNLLQPEQVKIEVFEYNATIVGYALLFTFWYNEFGGKVLNVDELYVQPAFQSQGIVSRYLNELNRKKEYAALSLEVLPENERAYALYKRMGYTEKETITLYKLLE